MPSVEITTGPVSVKLEATEASVGQLIDKGLAALERAHQIERTANQARAEKVGGYA